MSESEETCAHSCIVLSFFLAFLASLATLVAGIVFLAQNVAEHYELGVALTATGGTLVSLLAFVFCFRNAILACFVMFFLACRVCCESFRK